MSYIPHAFLMVDEVLLDKPASGLEIRWITTSSLMTPTGYIALTLLLVVWCALLAKRWIFYKVVNSLWFPENDATEMRSKMIKWSLAALAKQYETKEQRRD